MQAFFFLERTWVPALGTGQHGSSSIARVLAGGGPTSPGRKAPLIRSAKMLLATWLEMRRACSPLSWAVAGAAALPGLEPAGSAAAWNPCRRAMMACRPAERPCGKEWVELCALMLLPSAACCISKD